MKRKASITITSPEVLQRHICQQIILGIIDSHDMRKSSSTLSTVSSSSQASTNSSSENRLIKCKEILEKIKNISTDEFKDFEVTLNQSPDSSPKLEWKNQKLTLTKDVELILHTIRIPSLRFKKHCLIVVKPRRNIFKSVLGGASSSTSLNLSEPGSYLQYLESGLPVLALLPKNISGVVLAFNHRSDRASWLNEIAMLINTVPLDTAHLFELPHKGSGRALPKMPSQSELLPPPPQLAPAPIFKTHTHNDSISSTSNISIGSWETDRSSSNSSSPQFIYSACLQASPLSILNDRKYSHTLFEDIRKVSPLNLPVQPSSGNSPRSVSAGSATKSTLSSPPRINSSTGTHKLGKFRSMEVLRDHHSASPDNAFRSVSHNNKQSPRR